MALQTNFHRSVALLAVACVVVGCQSAGSVRAPDDTALIERASAVRDAVVVPEPAAQPHGVVTASHAEPAVGIVSVEVGQVDGGDVLGSGRPAVGGFGGVGDPRRALSRDFGGVGDPRRARDPRGVLEVGQPVEAYVDLALAQNPDIQAARKRLEAASYRVPQAASLKDPTFGMTVFPEPVQTAAGEQQVALMASQHLPWHGKRDTRAEVAAAEVSVARARLAAVELEVVEQVKRAYYELYFVQKAIEITAQTQQLLRNLERGLQSEYRTGGIGQHDLLRAQLEVSRLDGDLVRLTQQLESSRARLARWLHVPPDTPLRALDRLPGEAVPYNLDLLYQQAIRTRPELQAQLAALRRDCRKIDLARLDYFPDLTAGATWIGTATSGISPVANGRDPFLLGLSINVPMYRKRLDAGVREAEARACSSARQYDSLRDRTTEEVTDLFVRATSQQELVALFREEIIPKADQTLQVSQSAYKVGDVDFLQLIDNWQQLLRFQIAQHRLESQLLQTLATLERVVGGQP